MQGPSRFAIALVIISVIAVALVAIGLLSWQKLVFQKNQVDVQIADNRHELDRIIKELGRKQELVARLDHLKDELGNLDRDMVDYEYVPTYLRQIQKAAKESGNYLQSIQPSDLKNLDLSKSPFAPPKAGTTAQASGAIPPPATPPPAMIPKAQASTERVMRIGLDVKGTYRSVIKFLDMLRVFPKLIYVKTLSITPVKNTDGSSGVVARFETYAIIPPDQYVTPEDRKLAVSGDKTR
jgi:Tfp pilus assembly protein PilO